MHAMDRLDALTDGSDDTRLLTGAVVALIASTLVAGLQVLSPDVTWATPIGLIAPVDLAGIFAAMLLGGFVARQRRFRWLAPLLQLVALACTFAAYLLFDTGMPEAMRAPTTLFKLNAVPMLLGLVAAFAGAVVGERLAPRRRTTEAS